MTSGVKYDGGVYVTGLAFAVIMLMCGHLCTGEIVMCVEVISCDDIRVSDVNDEIY